MENNLEREEELMRLICDNPNADIPVELLPLLELELLLFGVNHDMDKPLPRDVANIIYPIKSPTYPSESFVLGVYNQREVFEEIENPLFVDLDLHGEFDISRYQNRNVTPKLCDRDLLEGTFKNLILDVVKYGYDLDNAVSRYPIFRIFRLGNPADFYLEGDFFSQVQSISYGDCGAIDPETMERVPRHEISLDSKISDGIVEPRSIRIDGQEKKYDELIIIIDP